MEIARCRIGCKIDIVGRQHFSMLGRLLSDDIRASL